ncbi:hypothetical protein [Stenotrophomonas sp.]|uniref:hypothetical protein n=1 Tax=Stenotrophomonas sp. TaxID=69392 RepID=UPI0028A21889|nr:hypothetical protein [Stenotrophomonas sp.]
MSNENQTRDFLDEHFAVAQVTDADTAEVTDAGQEAQQPDAAAQTQETVDAAQQPVTQAPEATTATETKDTGTVPYAAMKAERDKRQKLERELEEMRRAQPQQPAPSYFEDPEGYVQRIQNESTQRLYAALEATAREQHEDYDQMFEVVMRHAPNNPVMVQEVMTSPNPAMAAYKMGKKLSEFEQMQDPDAYRAKLEAEFRAKWDAEQAAKLDKHNQAAAAIPPDLSQARNTRGEFATTKSDVFTNLFERK